MLGVGLYNAARADAVENSLFNSLLEIRRLACPVRLGSDFLTDLPDPEKGPGDVSHSHHSLINNGVRMSIRTCVSTWDTARSRIGMTEDERSCKGKDQPIRPKVHIQIQVGYELTLVQPNMRGIMSWVLGGRARFLVLGSIIALTATFSLLEAYQQWAFSVYDLCLFSRGCCLSGDDTDSIMTCED